MSKLFDNLTEQTEKFTTPLNNINETLLNNFSELVDIQSKAFSSYAQMITEQTKAALEIKDSDSLAAFLKQQSKLAEDIQGQFKSDIEKLSELAGKLTGELGSAIKPGEQPKPKDGPKPAQPSSKSSTK